MVQMMAQATPGKDSKAERRQLEILAAASRVFRRKGLHATGMRDIAEESGMHVGNLYYYFRSKQELLAFCQEQTLSGLMSLAQEIRQTRAAADRQLFQLIVGHVVRLNEEMPGSLAHLEVEALDGPWRSRVVRQRNRYESVLRRVIQEGVDAGLLRSADPAVAAKAILGATNWTVKWYQPGGDKTIREIGWEFATLLVRGLLAPGRELQTPRATAATEPNEKARSH